MVRGLGSFGIRRASLPHGRGDGPRTHPFIVMMTDSSPRAWGWSAPPRSDATEHGLFPTGVGMVRPLTKSVPVGSALPHGRGDGPRRHSSHVCSSSSSPRAWGWSGHSTRPIPDQTLFPTGVGMVRRLRLGLTWGLPLPHGRGDGPKERENDNPSQHSSPRAWGWSDHGGQPWVDDDLFPTGVGMVRAYGGHSLNSLSLPHGRGDGPLPSMP